jgi:NAD(P)-dependent dehydrogenase (short-subunit alcohol dehydrogenase family)
MKTSWFIAGAGGGRGPIPPRRPWLPATRLSRRAGTLTVCPRRCDGRTTCCPQQFRAQIEVNLFGTLNVTRAVLPVMRRQHAGHVITISSTAGLASAAEFTSAYAASKFGLEGWMEALRVEVAPFGIHTTVVNPGFFRTELLSEQSTSYAEPSIADYDARRGPLIAAWKATHGRQAGDPAKLAQALLTIASQQPPPRRFLAGADAIATAEQKIADLQADIESNRQLSTSLAVDEAVTAA